jgi:hypothetical protein
MLECLGTQIDVYKHIHRPIPIEVDTCPSMTYACMHVHTHNAYIHVHIPVQAGHRSLNDTCLHVRIQIRILIPVHVNGKPLVKYFVHKCACTPTYKYAYSYLILLQVHGKPLSKICLHTCAWVLTYRYAYSYFILLQVDGRPLSKICLHTCAWVLTYRYAYSYFILLQVDGRPLSEISLTINETVQVCMYERVHVFNDYIYIYIYIYMNVCMFVGIPFTINETIQGWTQIDATRKIIED